MKETLNKLRIRKIEDDLNFITTDSGKYIIANNIQTNQIKNLSFTSDDKPILLKHNILLNDSNFENEVLATHNRNRFLFQGASLHIIVTTLRCNMNCVYCHASSRCENEKGFDMTKDTAKKTVDFIFQTPSDAITIELQGGEPLLNWDICKYIIEYAKEKNKTEKKDLEFSLVTNFTLMNEERMQYLIEKNIGICTSLDGPEELHNKNRIYTKNNNYNEVIHWIKTFNKEYEKINNPRRVYALSTLTKQSLKYPKEIIDQYVSLGIDSVHLRFLSKLGNAKTAWDHIYYSTEEFLEFWNIAMTYIKELQKKGISIKERIVEIMTKKITQEFDPNYLELRSPCGAVLGQLLYNHDGNIFTCDEGRMIDEDLFKIGDVNLKYKDVTTSKKSCEIVSASTNDQYTCCEACAYKPYCGVCPVCNYSEQGSIIAKIPETERCKIYKTQFDWVVKNVINELN